jgi:hypothetical protein
MPFGPTTTSSSIRAAEIADAQSVRDPARDCERLYISTPLK